MSAPALLACAAAAVCLGGPVIAATAQLEAGHRAAAAADSAALAAADALTGWVDGEACELAGEVAASMRADLVSCDLDRAAARATVSVAVVSPLGGVQERARAGTRSPGGGPDGAVGANGWAWPSSQRGVSQAFHDGYAIDLETGGGGELYSPYAGVVVRVGDDGGGLPAACLANPGWWRGPNQSVLIRHEYRGRILYSSHNHVAAGSPQAVGVQPGSRVRAGQRVATAGMSGCTSGPHTHFTLASHETNAFPDVNPFDFIGEP